MNIYLVLLITLLSCNTIIKHEPDANYYADIDLFNLKGIDSLKNEEINYPFISIVNINNQNRLIIYQLTSKRTYERLYTKKGDYWVCKYVLHDGDAKEFYTEYVMPSNKIVTTVFRGINANDSNNVLTQLEILNEKNKINYYYDYENEYRPNLDQINNYKLIINQHVYKYAKTIFYNLNTNLVIEEVEKDYKTDTINWVNKSCYKTNSKSYFWWSYFGGALYKNNCK